ncbi:MAG: hypothetical protein J0H88_17595 [Sphingomonadales bacterium]|nr:hypothetical protein [Sphingomonadales bacterium]
MRIATVSAISLALAVPGVARAQTPPDAATLKAIEAEVPRQSWYPDGYYDVRIAAESEQGETKGTSKDLLGDWNDGLGKRYDVIDCSAESPNALEVDPVTARYGFVASEVARLRSDFRRLKFPAALYAEPLLAFEKAKIEEATKGPDPQVEAARYAEREAAYAKAEREGRDPPPPLEDSSGGDEEVGDDYEDPYFALAKAVEANRERSAPKLPKVVAEGGCGAGGAGPIIVKTMPPQGEVLLVNAFAFKVCTRKVPDPWDRFACKWTEIETGVEKSLAGRYVYQVRWPDGTVRKGTRDIVPEYDTDQAVTVTFKKTGS